MSLGGRTMLPTFGVPELTDRPPGAPARGTGTSEAGAIMKLPPALGDTLVFELGDGGSRADGPLIGGARAASRARLVGSRRDAIATLFNPNVLDKQLALEDADRVELWRGLPRGSE
jgi:hypothetical protein